jgi:hypothetical protein
MGFEGFEEYGFGTNQSNQTCPSHHWNFMISSVNRDSIYAHTGHLSVKLEPGDSVYSRYPVYREPQSATSVNAILPFNPDTGLYLLSGWLKTDVAMDDQSDRKGFITVRYGGSSKRDTLRPTGPLVEGWQKIEGLIRIPYGATYIYTKLSPDPDATTWFDDLRIQPFNSSMKSYVYEPRTMKLMAELDENNFATFYEYDEQGALKRMKKETEQGIMTIKESRSSSVKKN